MAIEPYAVTPPDPNPVYQLRASDHPVGDVIIYKDKLLYVGNIQQRIFVPDMIEGVRAYAESLGFKVGYVIWDSSYDRFEFEITKQLSS